MSFATNISGFQSIDWKMALDEGFRIIGALVVIIGLLFVIFRYYWPRLILFVFIMLAWGSVAFGFPAYFAIQDLMDGKFFSFLLTLACGAFLCIPYFLAMKHFCLWLVEQHRTGNIYKFIH